MWVGNGTQLWGGGSLIGVNCVGFSPPYNKFIKFNLVVDLLVGVTGYNGYSYNAPVDHYCNDIDVVLVVVVPELIIGSTGKEFYVDHIFDCLMVALNFTIDGRGISPS